MNLYEVRFVYTDYLPDEEPESYVEDVVAETMEEAMDIVHDRFTPIEVLDVDLLIEDFTGKENI